MRHIGAAVLATIVAGSLAACTGSSGSGTPSSSGHVTTSAGPSAHQRPVATDAEIWSSSLCSRLDPRKVAKVERPGITAATARQVVATEIGLPTFDFCTVALQRDGETTGPAPYDVSYGVSANTWTAAEWASFKNERLQGPGGYHAEPLEIDGHSGLIDYTPGTGRTMVLVGDRVLTVGEPGNTHVKKQVIAELKVALPTVDQISPRPAIVALPACGKGDHQAVLALGGSAMVRRDEGSGVGLTCGWATRSSYARVYADHGSGNWPVVVKSMQRRWPDATTVNGVGKAAVYTDAHGGEPRTLRVATTKSLVFVQGSGEHVGKATLTALAKKIIGNY